MKIVQYTVNIGEYDRPRDDIKCITDIDIFKSNPRNSRLPKILSHKFIEADVSVYWDCNIHLRPGLDIEQVVKEYLGEADVVAMKCSIGRDCVYEEIEAAKKRCFTMDEVKKLEKQAKHYKSIGFPEHCKTLAAYQPLIRRHTPIVKAFNEAWWAEMCTYSYRDQCSFPVILSRFPDLKVSWINDFSEISYKNYRHKIRSLV